MLHSRKLRYIDEIARCGSIRKAAGHLNVASSAVNRQILALEDEIGTQLFERLPRGLRLTATGELFVEHIRDVLKDYDRLEARIRALKVPQLGSVSMVTTVGLSAGPLPGIVSKFLAEHPRIRVRLHNDSIPGTVLTPVLTGDVDLGLGFNLPATPGIRTLAAFEVPLGVVVPPGHPLVDSKKVSLSQVVEMPLVLAQPDTSLRNFINLMLAPLNAAIVPVLETNSTEMLKKLVINGTGVSLMNPLDVITECQSGELVYLPLTDKHIRQQPLKLVTRARAPLDATPSMFVEYLTSALTQLIEGIHSE